MLYKLRRYQRVKEQLKRLPARIKADVAQAILDLQVEPYPPTAEELRDEYAGIYKIKVDGWRILYRVDAQNKVVVIIAVKRRDKDTYRSMN